MRVLFIDPPSPTGGATEFGEKEKLASPNMGIIYIATYLKSRTDADVLVIDMLHNNLSFSSLSAVVKDFQPSLVGITSKTMNILSSYKVAGIIKAISPKTVIIIGGAHPTALPQHTLNECADIDAVVVQEGENTCLELYNRMKEGYGTHRECFVNLTGVVWRDKFGEIQTNKERELISDLDSLPFPDLSIVDYKRYRRVYNPTNYRFQYLYPVFASRGCPFKCTFCMPLLGRKHRIRSIDHILAEIELLNKRYNAKRIYFEDSLFCSRKEWFERFCEMYMKRGLHKKVQWGFETRIDTANSEMFRLAREAGCIYTYFGVESGSELVLRKANKGYSRDEIIEKVSAAKHAGIAEVGVSIILGLPYETKETIEETLRILEVLPYDDAGINILDVYPGTAVFDMADKGEGGLRWIEGKRMNWAAYSRTEAMVEVNDLSAPNLVLLRKKALRIVTAKARRDPLNLNLKRLAYVIELIKTDRRKLWRSISGTYKGEK